MRCDASWALIATAGAVKQGTVVLVLLREHHFLVALDRNQSWHAARLHCGLSVFICWVQQFSAAWLPVFYINDYRIVPHDKEIAG